MSFVENGWQWLLSPVATIALLAGIGYLFRDIILRFVTEKLSFTSQKELQLRQHKFDEKFDEVKRNFERIQSTQERLLTSFLEVSSERAKAVSKREIKASEAIWTSANELNRLIVTAKAADRLNLDAIEKLSASDRDNIKEFAHIFSKQCTPEFIESVNCQWTRLYVNEAAWAFYHAYSTILLSGALLMAAVEQGIPISTAFDKTVLKKAILEALPHQKPTFDKFPDIGSTLFLDELRRALVKELRKSIHGEQSTEKEAERARAIMDALPKDIP